MVKAAKRVEFVTEIAVSIKKIEFSISSICPLLPSPHIIEKGGQLFPSVQMREVKKIYIIIFFPDRWGKKRFFLFKSPTFFHIVGVSCCSVRETQCVRVRRTEPVRERESKRKIELKMLLRKSGNLFREKLYSMDFFFVFIYMCTHSGGQIAFIRDTANVCERVQWVSSRKLQNKPNMKWRLIAWKISYKLNFAQFCFSE